MDSESSIDVRQIDETFGSSLMQFSLGSLLSIHLILPVFNPEKKRQARPRARSAHFRTQHIKIAAGGLFAGEKL